MQDKSKRRMVCRAEFHELRKGGAGVGPEALLKEGSLLDEVRPMRVVDEITIVNRALQRIHRVPGRVEQKRIGQNRDKRLIEQGEECLGDIQAADRR